MASSAAARALEAAAEALDRRVRPILDQIDLRNHKQAVKLADTAIKKYGDHPLYQTVKAMALERMGRKQEALELVNSVRAGPLTEHILGMMQPIYRNLGRYDDATKAYEKFANEDPANLERQVLLFNAYAREYDYLKQQQVAMKLFKQSGREHFLMWAVCTLELQSLAAEGGPQGTGARMLQLAEALLRKKMGLKGLEGLESLLVFLSVLDLQQKHEAALDLIQGPAGALFTLPADKARLEGELQYKLGRYREAAAAFASVLRISPDDWAALQAYLDALLEYTEGSEGPSQQQPEAASEAGKADGAGLSVSVDGESSKRTRLSMDEVDRRLAEARGLLAELQGLVVQSGELLRGPFLAEVELEKRWAESRQGTGGAVDGERRVAEGIVRYFERHGTMVSFALDVRQHVRFLRNHDVAVWLGAQLHAAAERSATEPSAKAVHVLRRRIAALQVEEQLGLVQKMTDADLYARAVRLAELYQDSVPLLRGVAPRERGPGEELLVMAATCLVEGYVRTGERSRLDEAILVLEQGLFDRRWQSEYKLMLVSLYLHCGAVGPALAWFRLLDIKHIQLETMAHHILPHLLNTAQHSPAATLLRDLHHFHDAHARDGADMTLTAYRTGTYSKVREFVRFKERLERAHQLVSGRVETLLMHLAERADNATQVQALLADTGFGQDPLEWSSAGRLAALSFNEDLATRPWWTPASNESLLEGAPQGDAAARRPWHAEEEQGARLAREARWRVAVRRRCLLPRMLALTLDLGPPSAAATSSQAAAPATPSTQVPGTKSGDKSAKSKGKKKSGVKAAETEAGAGAKGMAAPASNGGAGASQHAEVSRGENGNAAAIEIQQTAEDEMRTLVEEFAGTLGMDKAVWESTDLGLRAPPGGVSVDALALAVFATSLQMMEARAALAGSEGGSSKAAQATAALPESFSSILRILHDLDESLKGQLFSTLETAGGHVRLLSPGAALPRLVTLVHGSAAWLLLAVQSWARLFPSSLKRKKKGGTEEDAVDDPSTLALYALRSLIDGAGSVFRRWADLLGQYLGESDAQACGAALREALCPIDKAETSASGGRVLAALQSWSKERQLEIWKMRGQSSGAVDDENEEALQVLDLEAVLRASLESSREVLEQTRTVALLRGNAFKKVNI